MGSATEGDVHSGQFSDRAALLAVARDQILASMEYAEANELPGLVRELRAVLKELEQLGVGKEASTVDDLRDRREKRRKAAGL